MTKNPDARNSGIKTIGKLKNLEHVDVSGCDFKNYDQLRNVTQSVKCSDTGIKKTNGFGELHTFETKRCKLRNVENLSGVPYVNVGLDIHG